MAEFDESGIRQAMEESATADDSIRFRSPSTGIVVMLCIYAVLGAFLYLAWQLWRAVAG